MKDKDIVREAMKKTGFTQVDMQKALNLKSQSSISTYLKGDSMRVDTFVKLLNVMGYSVRVTNGENEWTVGND